MERFKSYASNTVNSDIMTSNKTANKVMKTVLGQSMPPGTAAAIPNIPTPAPKPSDAHNAGKGFRDKRHTRDMGPDEAINDPNL